MKLIAMGEADIATGKLVPQEQVFANARAQLVARLKSND
jgi:predicted transcriptional regulator